VPLHGRRDALSPEPALGPAYLAFAGASRLPATRGYRYNDRVAAFSLLFFVFSQCMPHALSRPLRWSAFREAG
jgi:hypothetical protein